MTRISLKEQYDNSSVVKQIADLTDQIDGYDETIESAVSTANTAKTTADTAKTTADNAAAKNAEQDSRLSSIEAKDKTQDAEIVVINSKDSEQDIKIETLQQAADTAAKDIDAIESAATDLTNRVDGIESDLTATEAVVAANQSGLATAQGDIVALKGRTSVNEGAIASQATKNTEQDSSIAALQTLTNNITSHLISNVAVRDGTDNGSIMVELTEENGSKITSPNYAWGKPNTFQLVQGTEAGYLRGKLILSDGTEIESNDFQILQIIESDVYVTSITLTPYPTTGKLGGTIGYSNGNTAQINPIDVPTAPGVTSNINDLLSRMGVVESGLSDAQSSITALTSRMSSVESKNTTQDNQITALQSKDSTIDGQITALDSRVTAIEETPGIGAFTNTSRGTILGSAIEGNVSANSDGTGSVSGWSKVATAQSTADSAVSAAATAQSTADTAKSNAALAQSTADDANNKANSAITDATISGNTITFSRINDTSVDVDVPSISIFDLTYLPTGRINSSSTTTFSSGTLVYLYDDYSTHKIVEEGGKQFRIIDASPFILKKDTALNNYSLSDYDTAVINSIHNMCSLQDGEYFIGLIPVGRLTATSGNGDVYHDTTNFFSIGSYVMFNVKDGEIINFRNHGYVYAQGTYIDGVGVAKIRFNPFK